jgi:hypothetical protein
VIKVDGTAHHVNMELKPPTQSDRRQGLSKVGEMAVSMVPVVGGPLGVVLADVLARPYNRRMEEWLTSLAVALHGLEERVGSFEDLADNEAFVDAVAAGMRIAERSRREKRDLLRNAVLNTALAVDPDEDRQHIFFDLVDRLPPASLRLLKFVADQRYREEVIGHVPRDSGSKLIPVADIARMLSPAPDERSGDVAALFDKQSEHLKDEGLLGPGALSEAGYDNKNEYFAHDVVLDAVTRLGRSFLAFIEDPRNHDGQQT